MKAVVCDRYGPPDVLRIEEVEKPVPKEDEVLIRIHATTVSRSDVHAREANRSGGLLMSGLSLLISGPRLPRQRILGTYPLEDVVEATRYVETQQKTGNVVIGVSRP